MWPCSSCPRKTPLPRSSADIEAYHRSPDLRRIIVSLYLEQIRQLVALQRVDDAIHSVEIELEQAPKDLEDLKARFATTDAQRERVLEKIAHLKEQEKRINGEIDDDSTRIKKSKSKMMQVSNSREYQAMAREMDNMEKVNRSREEERTALMEEKMHQDKALQDVDAVWADLKAELETKQVSLETRLDEARKRLDDLAQVRSETGSAVPRPVLDRYEFIRRRLSHPVIVPVTAGVCSGCRITIPPQTFIELQGGHKIINCPNCQRLIYWVEHFNEETNQTADDMNREAE